MQEIWKPVVGYEGLYEVSNLGIIKSLPRYKKRRTNILKGHTAKYTSVILCKNGVTKNKLVHRLVGEAFLHRHHIDMEINHKNFNKKDNRVDNLEWVTGSDNMRHAIENNRILRGEDSHCSKLKKNDVVLIRNLGLGKYLTSSDIQSILATNHIFIDASTIRYILRGETWCQ